MLKKLNFKIWISDEDLLIYMSVDTAPHICGHFGQKDVFNENIIHSFS